VGRRVGAASSAANAQQRLAATLRIWTSGSQRHGEKHLTIISGGTRSAVDVTAMDMVDKTISVLSRDINNAWDVCWRYGRGCALLYHCSRAALYRTGAAAAPALGAYTFSGCENGEITGGRKQSGSAGTRALAARQRHRWRISIRRAESEMTISETNKAWRWRESDQKQAAKWTS